MNPANKNINIYVLNTIQLSPNCIHLTQTETQTQTHMETNEKHESSVPLRKRERVHDDILRQ